MIALITVTLPEYRRRVSVLTLMLVALVLRGQEVETLMSGENVPRVPDVVISGADAIIIVPPLPILPGGGIPVPRVKLNPRPFLPSPVGCEPDAGGASIVLEPVCIKLVALSDWLPFFLTQGDPPVPVMKVLGIRYAQMDRDSVIAQNKGRDE